MKKIVIALAVLLVATPAFALGPSPVDPYGGTNSGVGRALENRPTPADPNGPNSGAGYTLGVLLTRSPLTGEPTSGIGRNPLTGQPTSGVGRQLAGGVPTPADPNGPNSGAGRTPWGEPASGTGRTVA